MFKCWHVLIDLDLIRLLGVIKQAHVCGSFNDLLCQCFSYPEFFKRDCEYTHTSVFGRSLNNFFMELTKLQ